MLNQRFKLHISRCYVALLMVVYIATIPVVLLTSLGGPAKVATIVAVTAYLGLVFWRYGLLRSQCSIRGFTRLSADSWHVALGDGIHAAKLLPDSTVTRWVSIVRFQVDGYKRPLSCMLFPDALPKDAYRQFCVQARL